MTQPVFHLDEGDFWDNPLKEAPRSARVVIPPPGLQILAPRRVPLAERETLPIVVRRTCGGEDAARARFRDCAVITVMDVDRNELFAGPAADHDKVRPRPLDPRTIDHEATIVERHVVEAREQAGLPWRPGKYLATVLLRDVASNRAPFDMARTQYEDGEVARILAGKRGLVPPAPAWPEAGSPLPSFRPVPGSPALPGEVGVALSVERVVVLREGVTSVVHGAFRLPIGAEALVRGDVDAARIYGEARAIVPIHLLVMGSDVAAPYTRTLRVPAFDVAQIEDGGADGAVATGYFAIDLFALGGPSPRPQTYFLYVFSGTLMGGPFKTSTVTEDMLPPGAA
jgi:hypothetical protein